MGINITFGILGIAMHVTYAVYNVQGRGLVWSPEIKYVRRPLKSMTFILVIPIYHVKICRHLHDIYMS